MTCSSRTAPYKQILLLTSNSAVSMPGPSAVFHIRCILLFNQYSETNMMQFLFNLLRIKVLYMFRTWVAHPQEVLRKRPFVYGTDVWFHYIDTLWCMVNKSLKMIFNLWVNLNVSTLQETGKLYCTHCNMAVHNTHCTWSMLAIRAV
jgi:hypothetical protein